MLIQKGIFVWLKGKITTTRTFSIVKLPLHVLKMLSGISRVSYTRKVFLSAIEKPFYIGLFAPMTHGKTYLISVGNTDTCFHDFRYDFIT